MSFCSKSFPKIKDFVSKITAEVESAMVVVIDYTSKIKALEMGAGVQAIEAAIPIAGEVGIWIRAALNAITGVATGVKSDAEAIHDYLSTAKTDIAKDGLLVKLAQVAVASSGAAPGEKQSFFDTAVQVHIEGLK